MENWKKSREYLRIEDPYIYECESLSPDYSQETDLSYSQLKKLRAQWIKVLPKLVNLKHLFVGHQLNQEYFEAICNIPNLKSLEVKVSRIKDFSSIGKLTKLEYLDFCGSPAIKSLKGIENLHKLKHCKLSHFFEIENVNEISELKSLEKLTIFGNIFGKNLNLKNVEPISELKNLKLLSLDIKTNLDISSLLKLKKLECLVIPEYYHSRIRNKLSKDVELR